MNDEVGANSRGRALSEDEKCRLIKLLTQVRGVSDAEFIEIMAGVGSLMLEIDRLESILAAAEDQVNHIQAVEPELFKQAMESF